MFVFLDFILFCFEGVLEAFYSVLLLHVLLFFCCCYSLKNNWWYFSLNLSYLKTVYKICIFFRDIAFFIVIVAIPVFLRLIKIFIKLKGWVQTNSVS